MHIERHSSLWGLILPIFWQLCLSQSTDTWQRYVRAPNSRTVYPARVLSSWTTGDVTNPNGLLQGDSSLPSWPVGTTANASSYTGPNTGDGVSRTYNPQNAIDGNVITFWNDATMAQYPDILTINTPSLVSLSGITVMSNADGVPVDFTVEILQNGVWSTAATVTGNNATQILVPFQETASVSGVQITVTQDQDVPSEGEYTRINEVYPGLVQSNPTILARAQPNPPSWPAGAAANASSFTGPNVGDGISRTYDPQNAIDGNTTTFWNDATIAEYPDILTITTPSLNLSGITVLSNTDGVPIDFTVETLQSGVWSTAATITGNNATYILVPFQEEMVDVSGVQITVTQDQALSQGEYTRINEVYPGLVPDTGVPAIVLDFGIDVVGSLQISFGGASDNVPGVRLAFSETLTYLTDISDFSRSDNGDTITPGSDQIAVSADPYVWTDSYGCAYGDQVCADGLHGFRYVKISLDALASDAPYTQAYGEVAINSVSLDYTAFLGTPDTFTGWFECSDEELTQFWYDAAYTNDMVIDTVGVNTSDPRGAATPSLVGKLALLDGAKRDRDPYSGDIAVSGRSLYLTHNNVSEAVYNVIADLASHQRSDGWIPPASIFNYTLTLFDYPLYWVLCSYDYLLYTGDTAYIQEYYPTLQNVLNDYYPSVTDEKTSLLDKDLNGTSSYGDYAFLNRSGIVTYYNTLYVLALQNAASIATVVGNDQDAAIWSVRALTLSTAINNYLWDNDTGAYLDSLSGPIRHAQDGNSMAIIAGIASSSQTDRILSYFDSLALPYGNPFYDNDSIGSGFSERVYAFISYFEIQARFLSGKDATALDQIRRMYGWMSAQTITFWEGIGTNGSMYEGAYTSASHGWSTGVLPLLTNFILGAKPTGPGFSTWSVKPIISGDMVWARGVLDTPNGLLNVSWTAAAQFSILVGIPRGTSGIVSVPVSDDSNSTVLLDGATVWNGEAVGGFNATFSDGYVAVPVSGVSANVTVI